MKKIIILIFALFSILFVSVNQTHAVTVNSTYVEPTRAVFEYNEPNMQYAHYIWQFYSTLNSQFYNNLGIIAEETLDDFITRVYSFRSDVTNYIQINYPTYQHIELPDLQYLIIEYASGSVSLKFYNNLGGLISDYDLGDITNYQYSTYPLFVGYRVEVLDDDAYDAAYDAGYDAGYDDGKMAYGYYDGSDYITANDYGLHRYNAGLNENRESFGIDYNGNWLTAEQWGDIRYDDGYNTGLSGEIDWFSWSMTFFLMPFRILNIEILPGVRIGYFALFSLLLGVVGWFFFIVGKGGGRRR